MPNNEGPPRWIGKPWQRRRGIDLRCRCWKGECPLCDGIGRIVSVTAHPPIGCEIRCPACAGTGECPICDGAGFYPDYPPYQQPLITPQRRKQQINRYALWQRVSRGLKRVCAEAVGAE